MQRNLSVLSGLLESDFWLEVSRANETDSEHTVDVIGKSRIPATLIDHVAYHLPDRKLGRRIFLGQFRGHLRDCEIAINKGFLDLLGIHCYIPYALVQKMKEDENYQLIAAQLTAAYYAGRSADHTLTTEDVIKTFREIVAKLTAEPDRKRPGGKLHTF